MIPGITINPNGSISTEDGVVLDTDEVKALIKDFQEQQHRSEQYVILGRRHTSGSLQTLIHPEYTMNFKVGCVEFTRDQAIGFINEYEKRAQSVMDIQVYDGMRLRGKLSGNTFIVRSAYAGNWFLIREEDCMLWRRAHCASQTEGPLLRAFFDSTADSRQLEILKP